MHRLIVEHAPRPPSEIGLAKQPQNTTRDHQTTQLAYPQTRRARHSDGLAITLLQTRSLLENSAHRTLDETH